MSEPTVVKIPSTPKKVYKKPEVVTLSSPPDPVQSTTLEQPKVKEPEVVVIGREKTEEELVDLNFIDEEYADRLVKEDVLADPRLMEIVRSSLEARFTPRGALTKARRTVSGLTGAAIGGLSGLDYRQMSDEKVFEIYQNYQRSFAAGQSVTVANELVYGMSSSDEIKAKLGAGYTLFDKMDNAFTGDGSWPEMADAIFDYTKAVVYDPTTILSLGLGKLFSAGATKASTAAYRALTTQAYRNQIAQGVAKETALRNITTSVAKAMPYATADALFASGVDVLYQAQLIDTNAQDEYNKTQTQIAGIGTLFVIPTMVGLGASIKELRRGPLADTFLAYKKFDETLLEVSLEQAEKDLRDDVASKIKVDTVDENFGLLKGDTKNFLVWQELKDKADGIIRKEGQRYTDSQVTNAFYKYLFLGDPSKDAPAYSKALKDAGFTAHEALIEKYGTKTAVLAQTLDFLPDEKVSELVNKFEKDTGYKLRFMDEDGKVTQGSDATSKTLKAHLVNQTTEAGRSLKMVQDLLRTIEDSIDISDGVLSEEDAIKLLKGEKPDRDPKKLQFALSVYKRLLTSHLSTTGANIKGFAALVSINTAADLFTASIDLTQAGLAKIVRNEEAAEKYFNRAYGSFGGSIRRSLDVVSPDIPIEYANKILSLRPDVAAKLFRDVSGDGGVRDALSDFNLDKANILYKGVDAATKGAQTITLVRLQDELTKRWTFGSNLNQEIMRAYGMSPEKFFAKPNASVLMTKDKFQNVLDRAGYRATRETASVNWSTLPGNSALRTSAKEIERLTNRTLLGFAIPFGSFFNTTVATMGDLIGVNAIFHTYRRATGKNLDYTTPTGAEDLGKIATFYTALYIGLESKGGAKDRINNNLAYNQDQLPDGSIQDRTFDWPVSTMRLMSQILAHGLGDSKDIRDFDRKQVPKSLLTELGLQIGGQAVRDLDDIGKTIRQVGQELLDSDNLPESLMNIGLSVLARPIQGATRPLDPINQVVGLVTDGNLNPDLRQGNQNLNQIFKYINNIITTSEPLEKRATPTRGLDFVPDVGKQLLGVRGLSIPNLVEQMMNAAGKKYWEAIRFSGPAEIKNRMDAIAGPYFEIAALRALKNNPTYFKENLQFKEEVLENMKEEVKENVEKALENGLPSELNLVKVLSGKDKDKIKRIMDALNIEGEVKDLLNQEDGLENLNRIKTLLQYYDEFFSRAIK